MNELSVKTRAIMQRDEISIYFPNMEKFHGDIYMSQLRVGILFGI
jgi:hypothetical protein